MTGKDYRQPAPRGFTDITEDIAWTVRDGHRRSAELNACGGNADHHWMTCETFALMRLRGICHTVWVIHMPGDGHPDSSDAFYVIDDINDGPAAAIRGLISEPIRSWGDAILRAVRLVVLDDGEVTETLTRAQRWHLSLTDRNA